MTRLSVNINKIATLRNSRGGNVPDLLQVAKDIQLFGAGGITVHPRPDQRHIRYQDVYDLRPIVNVEYNIEGNPIKRFMDLVLEVKPDQVTLVPDAEDVLTSNSGWDTITHKDFLSDVISTLKEYGIRVSIFIENDLKMIEGAKAVGAHRIELYTEAYARAYSENNIEKVIQSYKESANLCKEIGLGVNAGHDLNLQNVQFFKQHIDNLLEVSIGHALIAEALYMGLDSVIAQYLKKIK